MNKLFATLSIALISAFGFNAAAQTAKCDKTDCTQTEQCAKKGDKKCDKKCDKKGEKKCDKKCDKKGEKKCDKKREGKCAKGQQPAAFAQDKMARPTDIETLAFEGILMTPEQQTKIDAIKAERKANCQQATADRQQCKRDYINKVKEVLTPEQYVTFLENIVLYQPQGGPRHHGMMRKGNCPQGPRGPQGCTNGASTCPADK